MNVMPRASTTVKELTITRECCLFHGWPARDMVTLGTYVPNLGHLLSRDRCDDEINASHVNDAHPESRAVRHR